MPVTTRSQSRLLSAAQVIEPQLSLEPSKPVKRPFKTTESAAPEQLYQLNRARPSLQTTRKESLTPQDSSNRTPPQDSGNETPPQSSNKKEQLQEITKPHSPSPVPSNEPPPQDPNNEAPPQSPQDSSDKTPPHELGEKEPLQAITKPHLPSPILSNVVEGFWPCLQCSCRKGIFKDLVDSCVACGHSMDYHEPHDSYPWNPFCDYLCERKELVTSILNHVRQNGVMVIRATPQVGKSILLKLLGDRIIQKELDLEPVYFEWQKREKRKDFPYKDYLTQKATEWRESNSRIRPRNSNARTIYLIDEAQGSYEEEDLWSLLKNYHNGRTKSLFVLVCVYGAIGVSYTRDPNIESQAQRMHSLHRVELRPTLPGSPCMLFQREEVEVMVRKFAIRYKCKLESGVVEYIYTATNGHPGMVGLLLSHLDDFSFRTGVRIPRTLSPEFLHKLIVQHEDSFVEWLSRWGRGVWSPWCEGYVEDCLRAPQYSHIRLLDIKKALREVAMQPYGGLTRLRQDFDAFAFCHKWGLLHTEQPILGSKETKFTFASPLHRRVAYRRLFPGREPDATLKNLSLQQICTNAIARFSPGTLQNRRYSQSNGSWGIPEAAFQDEMYCCLSLELHYLPILSEYSHTKDGRIDFYVSDQRWGIEVLQCGSNTEIAKHTARFATCGKYQMWDIMDDYIILNFCPRAALREVVIQDEKIQSHVFHVVVEPDELTAEIYTHDKQLLKAWSLSEGRQRINTDDLYDFNDPVSDTGNCSTPLQDEPTQREGAMIAKIKEMKLQMERQQEEMRLQIEREKEMRLQIEREKEMRLQIEQEKEEMRLQIEQEKEEMRLQIEREEDQEEIVQEQDKLVPGKSRKRKRPV